MPSQSQCVSTRGEKSGNQSTKSHGPSTKKQRQNKGKNSKKARPSKPADPKTPTSRRQLDPPGKLKSEQVLQLFLDFLAEANALKARLAKIKALHAQWRAYDMREAGLESEELVAWQRQQCKDVKLLIFRFVLQEAQIDAIYMLFYDHKDLLLLAKTGFEKSLIFQLILFMLDPTGVVIILMPLKLFQVEQNAMINCIPTGKAIALTGNNNNKQMQEDVATKSYTHVFTSPEIALSKAFQDNILDNWLFASRLLLLVIDEIHLVEKWGKNF